MKSMTGFGRASLESNGKNYIIEIKTVNNKYSDITVKSPKRLSFMEDKIRKQIANRITRGKVEVSVSFFVALHRTSVPAYAAYALPFRPRQVSP